MHHVRTPVIFCGFDTYDYYTVDCDGLKLYFISNSINSFSLLKSNF